MNINRTVTAILIGLGCTLTGACSDGGDGVSTTDTGAPADSALTDSATSADTTANADTVDTTSSVDTSATPDTSPTPDTAGPDTSTPPDPAYAAGCADGTREGFINVGDYPGIAGCTGAWSVPGLFNKPPLCGRQGGNTGANAAGTGCTVTDLCAEGWRVCYGREKVVQLAGGCDGAMIGATSPAFFTTQMSSTGAFECATGEGSTNDLFGCGDLGCDFTSNANVAALCAPLVISSHDLCKGLRNDLNAGDWCNHLGKYPALPNAWSCGTDGSREALNVTKSHPDQQGGVLCCRL